MSDVEMAVDRANARIECLCEKIESLAKENARQRAVIRRLREALVESHNRFEGALGDGYYCRNIRKLLKETERCASVASQ